MRKTNILLSLLILMAGNVYALTPVGEVGEKSAPAEKKVSVTVDFGKVTNTCGNMLFGGCQNPSLPHSDKILPMLVDAGFNCIRCDIWLEKVLPQDITLDDYRQNKNDVQNPDNWNYADLELMARAKKSGMKVMLIIAYCPSWLSYNGKSNGVPRDLNVYADIVRKVYERYCRYVDWVEVYNEPGYFLTTENSPYTSRGKALADIYATCAEVVRKITPRMPMGGTSVVLWGDGGVGGETNTDFFADGRITHENFNFYSHHVYGDYGIPTEKETVSRVKKELGKFGFGDLPVYFTEWSTSINAVADSVTYTGSRSHLFVGNCLVNWMRDGLQGAMHWNYMQAFAEGGEPEPGIATDAHGMYVWNVKTQKPRLLPKANVFTMLSKSLGLGEGENTIAECTTDDTQGFLNAVALTNAAGDKCMIFVNGSQEPVQVVLSAEEEYNKIRQYTVTYTSADLKGKTVRLKKSGNILTLPPASVVGIRFM